MEIYYVWQTNMYGKKGVDENSSAEIFKFRPMPATPAGDLVGKVKNGRIAQQICDRLNQEMPGLKEAKKTVIAMAGENE